MKRRDKVKIGRQLLVLAVFPVSTSVVFAEGMGANDSSAPATLIAQADTTVDQALTLATVSNQLNILEKFYFNRTYSDQVSAERLKRLEMLVFRAGQTGSDGHRIKHLIAALPPQSKDQVTAAIANLVKSEPTANPLAPPPPRPDSETYYSQGREFTVHFPTAQPQTAGSSTTTAVPGATELSQGTTPSGQAAVLSTTASGSVPTATEETTPTIASMQSPPFSPAQLMGSAQASAPNYQAQLDTLYDSINKLVKKFYPNAKITSSGDKMHFEYKCKQESDFYHPERTVYTPQEQGILGDIALQPGQYNQANKNRLPSEVPDGFHTNLTMAPYSKIQGAHLLTHLSFPSDMDSRFKSQFEALINSFNTQELADRSAARTATRLAVAAHSAAHKAGVQEQQRQISKAAEAAYQAAFGAPNMSEHWFSQAQFRVMMPDEIKTTQTTQAGASRTRYSADAVGGSFEVSYLSLPSLPGNGAQTDAFFGKIANDLVQEIQGSDVTQGFTSLKGAPGWQMSVGAISGKPGYGAIIRIYIVDNSTYENTSTHQSTSTTSPTSTSTTTRTTEEENESTVRQDTAASSVTTTTVNRALPTLVSPQYTAYEVIAVGEQQWLGSPAVENFLDSFEFVDSGSGQWSDSGGQQHWLDQDGWEHWQDKQGQEHMWDKTHRDRRLGVRKY